MGRSGDALMLTTGRSEAPNTANVNAENANIVISCCESNTSVTVPDYSSILNKWEQPLYRNYLGCVVGQRSWRLPPSGWKTPYTGAERGLGNTQYPDVGTSK